MIQSAAEIDWAKGVPLTVGPFVLGLYQPSPETVGFWQGVEEGELRVKHCRTCGHLWHPKRIVCTSCSSTDLDWKAASGRGSVYSFSEVHRAPTPAFQASVPYALGLVALEEKVHILTRFFPEPGPIEIGAPARLAFKVLELGRRMPVFMVGSG